MRLTVNELLFAIGTLLGGAAFFLGGYMAWQQLNPPKAIGGEVEPGCDLHRATCGATFPGGARVTLTVAPRPIPIVTPLTLEVEVSGLEPEAVEVDIASPDMYMGLNRRTLLPAGAGRYSGKTMLAVCTRGRMRWRAVVTVRAGRAHYSAPFLFETTLTNSPRS
jgi:hypothetical protein